MLENMWLKNKDFLLKMIRKSPQHNSRKHGFILFHNILFCYVLLLSCKSLFFSHERQKGSRF